MNISWIKKFSAGTPYKQVEISREFMPLRDMIVRLPENFKSLDQTIYKGRNEIKVAPTGKGDIVIKQFGKIFPLNRFIYAWIRSSKAKRCFEHARRLLKKGIDTPRPVAYVDCYQKGRITTSMYLYLYCRSTGNVHQVLKDENYPDREKLLRDYTAFTFMLNQKQVYHRDYNPTNVLFEKRGSGYHFALIDINRIHFGKIGKKKRYRLFMKIYASEQDLRIIAKEYARLYGEDETYVTREMLSNSRRFIRRRARKKSLKRKLGL